MPEGPEIRRVADRLAEVLVDQRVERVRFGLPRLKPEEGVLSGQRVLEVEPRGKALLTHFENGLSLYSHNQLYGVWRICPAGKPPNLGRSLRVALETADRWALLYSASDIEVLEEHELDQHPFLARIGPDVLARDTTPARIRQRLRDRRFAGRSLGALLLDQSFVAGLGNYLRSEILFFTGLRPEARPKDLDDETVALLARQIREVTRRSYRTGGITELPDEVREAKRLGERRRSFRHAVFGRSGKPCRRCSARIRRSEVGTRRLYLCPHCQPSRRRRA